MAVSVLVSPTGIRDRLQAIQKKYPELVPLFAQLQNELDIQDQRTRNLASNVLGLLPAVSIDGSHINSLSITNAQIDNLDAGKITTGILSAARIAAAAIDATKLNIRQIIVVGLTLTNNSPSAGKVAWSACQVYFAGLAYNISSGSTAATTDQQIYWTVGNSTFTSGATFTPTATVFGIATNTSGTSDISWNKLALSGVQEEHLGFGLITGVQPSTIAEVVIGFGDTTGSFTIVNIPSGSGGLFSFGLRINAPFDGTPNVGVRITVDGGTPFTFLLINSAFLNKATTLATRVLGNGTSAGDTITFAGLNLGFSSSLLVEAVNVNAGGTDGQLQVDVLYGLAV